VIALWSSRHLLAQWVRRDVTVQYRQSLLGPAWAVVQPLLLLGVYGLILHNVLDVGDVPGSYVVFALCGLAPWTFMSSSLMRSVGSLADAAPILKQVYFPRAIVPLAGTGVTAVDLTASTLILLVAQVALNHELHASTLALLPIYAALLLMMGALAVVAALIGGLVRDLRFVMPLVLQLGFIVSPVMYPRTLVPDDYRWVYDLNPVGRVIGALRESVVLGHWPSPALLLGLLVTGALSLLLALKYSASVESRLPDLL
jgi:lipopolysaccharide transport system permease protein